MLPKNLFRKPRNPLEDYDQMVGSAAKSAQEELCVVCPDCRTMIFTDELVKNHYVCSKCSRHFRLGARRRLIMLLDDQSFEEWDEDVTAGDPLGFPDYEMKVKNARLDSSEREAVITGSGRIGGHACALFVMDAYFMMGSMGTAVGEKLTRLFERAADERLPVIGFTVSGGARIQEGILSLMQMAKVSAAVRRFDDAGGLYIVVLTDPTTGGVVASFAMEADITLAEPKALIGFAGPRVIEQTMHQKLPEGFQRSEFLLAHGFVDKIVDRRNQREMLERLLAFHEGGEGQ